MTTVVGQVVGAVVAALQAAPAVSANVARVRLRPWSEATASAVAVRPLDATREEAAMYGFGGPESWRVRVAVECYARTTSTTPDAAIDALVGAVYGRLMADPTLGGQITAGLEPLQLAYDFDAEAEKFAAATLVFSARIRTAGTTLS